MGLFDYSPLYTGVKFLATPTSIPAAIKATLIDEASTWIGCNELKRGTYIQKKPGILNASYKLKQLLVNMNGKLYVKHEQPVAKGMQGKIYELESLSDGTFFYLKQSTPLYFNTAMDKEIWEEAINEVDHLSEQGLCYSFSQIVHPSRDGFFINAVEHQIMMPNLGTDLKKQFEEQDDLTQIISDEVRFRVAIEMSFELAKLHGGLLSVRPKMHRDLKLGNIVLGPKGIQIIDLGFAEYNPEKRVFPNKGTDGYIELPYLDDLYLNHYIPFCEREGYQESFEAFEMHRFNKINPDRARKIERANERSGRFFDVDALRRTLYAPLRMSARRQKKLKAGILTQELVDKYELDRYLEHTYSMETLRYVNEDALRIDNAMTMAAVLIACQVKLSHEQLDLIIVSKDLAAAVVGTYFSYQKNDWLCDGHGALLALLNLPAEQIYQRAQLVRLGLSHVLNEALEDERLSQILSTEDILDEQKRITAFAFQRAIWKEKAEVICACIHRFNESPDMSLRCLEAYYRGEMDTFEAFLLDEPIVEKRSVSVFNAKGVRHEVSDLLKAFPIRAKEMLMLEKHSAVLNWLYAGFYEIDRSRSKARQAKKKLERGVRLYAFLVNAKYQEAILFIYEMRPKNEAITKVLRDLLLSSSNADKAELIVGLKGILPLKKLHEFFQEDVFNLSWVLWEKQVKFENLARLIDLKANHKLFSLLVYGRGRFRVYPEVLSTFNTINSREVVLYMLSNKAVASYLFDEGFENEKVKLMATCIELSRFETLKVQRLIHERLADEVFLRAGVVLGCINLLTQDNILLLVTDNALCVDVSRESDKQQVADIDVDTLKMKLICSQLSLSTEGLELQYLSLKYYLLKAEEQTDDLSKRGKLAGALIKLYWVMNSLKIQLNGFENEQILGLKANLTYLFETLEQSLAITERGAGETAFDAHLSILLMQLSAFARNKVYIETLETIHIITPQTASRWFFSLSFLKPSERKASKYLHDIAIAVQQIEEGFDVEKSSSFLFRNKADCSDRALLSNNRVYPMG